MSVSPIPKGYHTLTPYLTFRHAKKAIEYYKQLFNAVKRLVLGNGDKIHHAELQIGDSVLMLADEMPGTEGTSSGGCTSIGLHLYVTNVDDIYKKALSMGAKSIMEPMDMYYGDRIGSFTDIFGIKWSVATHIKDVSPAEIMAQHKEFVDSMSKGQARPVTNAKSFRDKYAKYKQKYKSLKKII